MDNFNCKNKRIQVCKVQKELNTTVEKGKLLGNLEAFEIGCMQESNLKLYPVYAPVMSNNFYK